MAGRSRTTTNAKKRKQGRRGQPLPCTYWLGVGVVTAGLGVALTAGAGIAAAADDTDSGRTSSASSSADSASPKKGDDKPAAADEGDDEPVRTSPGVSDADDEAADDEAADDEAADDEAADDAGDEDTVEEDSAAEDSAAEDEEAIDDDPASESRDDGDSGETAEETEPVAATVAVQPDSNTGGGYGQARTEWETTRAELRDTDTEPAAVATEAPPAPHSPAATTVTAAAVTTAAGEGSLVSGRVTVGTILVDIMTWIGLAPPPASARLLPINVPGFIESWWSTVRTQIYRENQQPAQPEEPGQPQEPESPELPDNGDLPLVWETDFTSIEEALKYWGVQTGRWGQSAGENQYYTDFGNVYLDDEGHIVIVTRQEAAPDGLGAPHDYTSTRLVTYGKASIAPNMRVVARIQMPYTQGSLPAFWTVGLEPGHEFDWPRQGEIDIVELPGFGGVDGSKHWTGNIHGPAAGDNTVDVKLHGNDQDMGVDLSQGFHEYGIDWYPDRIIWHVDGQEVGSITQQQYEALGGDWTPFSGAWPHYLILNNAVGNPWTGDPDETSSFPMEMKIDWVKVYQL
jgi:beta-glucanase (GH16 family)